MEEGGALLLPRPEAPEGAVTLPGGARQLVGGSGIVLALVGVALDNRWVIWGAGALLVVAIVLRLVDRRRGPPSEPPAE